MIEDMKPRRQNTQAQKKVAEPTGEEKLKRKNRVTISAVSKTKH
jgi:hypothetical protein